MADLEHLNELYGESEDPWHMRGGWSAQRRRDLLLASLNHARYGNTFVPGCGSGELLPALARSREKSRKANCQALLRQVYLLTRIYADEHDGEMYHNR